jgi:hypothetical protein
MNIIRCHLLRLVGISAAAIAIPQLASASDSGNGAAFKLAMGPMSAAQKNQGAAPSEKPHNAMTKPLHHSKHKHAGSATQPK